VAAFKQHLDRLPIPVACDDEVLSGAASPLAQPLVVAGHTIGNRFAVQPMEGWDGTPDGQPSALTVRRWQGFGASGAKLVWGGEAVAVRPDGRANPHQLTYTGANRKPLADLLAALVQAHRQRHGTVEDLLLGLQLTHSGRFCRPGPDWGLKPRVAYRHPVLDAKFGVRDDRAVLTDGELGGLIGDYVAAARFAREAGFHFVDIKHCHGYLLHEFLSAHDRPGPYGGSFENRTRLLREIVAGIRQAAPGLLIGVRLSAFDFIPFAPPAGGGAAGEGAAGGEAKRGEPIPHAHLLPYRHAFGVDPRAPTGMDLGEPAAFLRLCRALDIPLVNLTAGSPYTTPHVQRPALFPPSDGYLPPEDPLLGCARLLQAAGRLKREVPELVVVGTGYTYFQDYLPHVAQAQVRLGHVDVVGLGRMMLSYPGLADDVLAGRPLDRGRVCRTFSDCTTAPRNQMVSGCYPLDDFYKARPEALALKRAKKKPA
jgi:2,4-dienoyl-CoA reductase-like NADH-dependent reductase (Old Yellow Enzyme family)